MRRVTYGEYKALFDDHEELRKSHNDLLARVNMTTPTLEELKQQKCEHEFANPQKGCLSSVFCRHCGMLHPDYTFVYWPGGAYHSGGGYYWLAKAFDRDGYGYGLKEEYNEVKRAEREIGTWGYPLGKDSFEAYGKMAKKKPRKKGSRKLKTGQTKKGKK